MNTCKKCGSQTEGNVYAFHHTNYYGVTPPKDKKVTNYLTFRKKGTGELHYFGPIAESSYCICTSCLKKWALKKFFINFIPALFLLFLLVYFGGGTNENMQAIEAIAKMLFICYLALLFYNSFSYVAPKRFGKGEKMAIEIGKKELSGAGVFWDRDDYKQFTKDYIPELPISSCS